MYSTIYLLEHTDDATALYPIPSSIPILVWIFTSTVRFLVCVLCGTRKNVAHFQYRQTQGKTIQMTIRPCQKKASIPTIGTEALILLDFNDSSYWNIVISCVSLLYSTRAPRFSLINRTGTKVLPGGIILAAQSSNTSWPFT